MAEKFYDFINPQDVSQRDLKKIVRRMTKNANRRLGNIERLVGTSSAYRQAARRMGYKKNVSGIRFNTKLAKMTKQQLAHQFNILREFLTSETATVRGALAERSSRRQKFYEQAKERGFTGSRRRLEYLSDILWNEVNERRLSSNVAYYVIQSGRIDLTVEILKMDAKERRQKRESLLLRAMNDSK